MTSVDTFPDVEGGLRTYLRADSDLAALIGTRVFFGVPDTPTFPLVVVKRVGGTDDGSDAPIDQAIIQIDVWGSLTASGHGDKAQAESVRRVVRKILYRLTMRGRTALDASTVCYGAVVQDDRWLPDQLTAQPRYAISALVTARAA